MTRLHFRRIDALLFLMAVIWGTNYAIIKHAFRELDPQAFNAIRMVVASAVFLAVLAVTRTPSNARHPQGSFASIFYTPSPVSGRDWLGLAGLGLVGQCFYQYLFVGGLAATSVSNCSQSSPSSSNWNVDGIGSTRHGLAFGSKPPISKPPTSSLK